MNSVSQIPEREHRGLAVPVPEPGAIGWWTGNAIPVPLDQAQSALRTLGQPVYILKHSGRLFVSQQGAAVLAPERPAGDAAPPAQGDAAEAAVARGRSGAARARLPRVNKRRMRLRGGKPVENTSKRYPSAFGRTDLG